MKRRSRAAAILVATLASGLVSSGSSARMNASKKGTSMTNHAHGTFEVKINPLSEDKAEGSTLGRMSVDKELHGDLEGTGKGEMLTAMTSVKTSAGYVAVERVTGTLHGKKGSFVLLHRGVMTGAAQELLVTVVPDSGTGQLAGLAGTFIITIADGKHSYDLAYTLPEAP